MSRRRDQAGHRTRPRKMARGEHRVRQELAEYHPEKGIPARSQGFRGHGRQVRKIFFPRARDRRLILKGCILVPWREAVCDFLLPAGLTLMPSMGQKSATEAPKGA